MKTTIFNGMFPHSITLRPHASADVPELIYSFIRGRSLNDARPIAVTATASRTTLHFTDDTPAIDFERAHPELVESTSLTKVLPEATPTDRNIRPSIPGLYRRL